MKRVQTLSPVCRISPCRFLLLNDSCTEPRLARLRDTYLAGLR
jgi:hypothetical protein